MTRWMAAAVLAVALAFGAGQGRAQSVTNARGDDPVMAQRGSITMTQSQVQEMVRNSDPETRRALESDPSALSRAVRDHVLQLSVLAEAQSKQYDTRPDVIWRAEQARIGSIVDSYVASLTQPDPSYPSEQDIEQAYEANKSRLMIPRQYHLAQIFIAVPESNPPPNAEADAQRQINEIRTQIVSRRGDFATLARRASQDHTTAANGGDLGWLREDQIIPPVRNAVAGLIEGGLSEPIRAPDGWHLVRLLGTRAAGPAPLPAVRDALIRALRQQKQQENARAYINGLLKDEPIQLNEIAISKLVTK